MKLQIYADTSVFGGCFDDEFRDYSTALIEQFRKGEKILTISDLTLQELQNGPKQFIEFTVLEDEAKILAKRYLDEKAISKKFLVDAQI